jgi:mRNA interferase RelE/StbE
MAYQIHFLDDAIKDLKQLDKTIAQRIVKKLQWLSENISQLKPEQLSENLVGFYKLRIGDYRVIYEIFSEKNIVVIHHVGHRSTVYKG